MEGMVNSFDDICALDGVASDKTAKVCAEHDFEAMVDALRKKYTCDGNKIKRKGYGDRGLEGPQLMLQQTAE